MPSLTKSQLQTYLDDTKSAGGASVSYVVGKIERRLRMNVAAGRSTIMEVGGVFKHDKDQQLWISAPSPHEGIQIARLCCTPLHDGSVHWHYYRLGRAPEWRPADVPLGLDLSDPATLFIEVFVPRLKIVDYVFQGELRP